MASLSRRLFRDFVVYGGGEFALRATGFIMLPVYTHILAADEYGAWGFMTTAVGLFSAVLVLGGDTAYARFFFEAKSQEERRTLASTWFIFLAVWTGGISVFIALLSRPMASWFLNHPSYGLALAFAILSTPLAVMNIMLGEVLRNEFRAVPYTILNTLGALLLIAATLIFVVGLGKELTGLAFGTVLALAIMLPIRVWSVRDHLRLRFSRDVLAKVLRFGVPLVPVSIAYWVFAVSDRIVLAKMSTLRELGLYTVAGSVTAALALVHATFGRAFSPHAMRLYEEDQGRASAILGRLLVYILVLFGAACVTISVFAHELLRVLATPQYFGAAVAVGPLALGYLFYVSTQVTALPITLTKETMHLARVAWVAAVLNLGLNLALVPFWGMLASAWATAAAYLFLTLRYASIGQRLWPIHYDIRRTVTVTLVAVVLTAAAPALPDVASPATLLLKFAFVLVYVGALVTLRVVDRGDLQRVRSAIGRNGAMSAE
jgi:O-antigen/teichoic acid export membrane protein